MALSCPSVCIITIITGEPLLPVPARLLAHCSGWETKRCVVFTALPLLLWSIFNVCLYALWFFPLIMFLWRNLYILKRGLILPPIMLYKSILKSNLIQIGWKIWSTECLMVGCPISNKYCLYSTVKLSSTLNIDAGYFQETYIVNTQSAQWFMPSVSAAWYRSDRILQLMHIMSKLALLFRVWGLWPCFSNFNKCPKQGPCSSIPKGP